MRIFELLIVSLFGGSLSSNAVYSHRMTRANLLRRKASEFESDARIRFEGGVDVEECLGAFKRMIDDIAISERPVRQLELIASRIDSDDLTADSLSETVVNLMMDFASIVEIDIMAYPGILDSEKQAYLARLLSIASRIGISRTQMLEILREGPEKGALETIEREVQTLMDSTQETVSASFLELLGLAKRPGFSAFVSAINSPNFIPHFIYRNVWTSIQNEFSQVNLTLLGNLLFVEEMWDVLSWVQEALWNIPVDFVNLNEELSVFISAVSDIGLLVNNPTQTAVNQAEINQRIIDKLRPLLPILEGYSKDALSEFSEWRSALTKKLTVSLPVEAQIILTPRLLRLVNNRLVHFLQCDFQSQALFTRELKLRSTGFLNVQIDGYIEAIQRGGAQRISVANMIESELISSRAERGTTIYRSAVEETRLSEKVLRTASEFARKLGINILQSLPSSDHRNEKSRIVIAACIQLECDRAVAKLVHFTDEELDNAVKVLSGMVARRNFLLSLNEDEPAALVNANLWLLARATQMHNEYANWVTVHLLPPRLAEILPVLRQRGFLREHMRNILTNFEPPERLVSFSQRVEAVYRIWRRKIGGPVGKRLHLTLLSALALPSRLLWVEIEWKFIDANLSIRNALEAVFMDFLDLIQIGASKIVTFNDPQTSQESANSIIHDLERMQNSLKRIEPLLFPEDLDQQAYQTISRNLERISADIKRQKNIFQA